MMLARAGWWGGDPGRVLRAPAHEVLTAAQYEVFSHDYESTMIEMNKETR